MQIGTCMRREAEIPKQKNKFDIHKKRLGAELEERENTYKSLEVEQRKCEGDIEENLAHIVKYNQQLNVIKKNEEYQALLHEIDILKKKNGVHEERVLAILIELDEAKIRLAEDRKRINEEMKDIDNQCSEIDDELAEAVQHRKTLETLREPLATKVDGTLLQRYQRIRSSRKSGPALVPLNGETCGGCHMHERAQIVNEVIAGENIHTCQHCGRLLYYPANFEDESVSTQGSPS